jgi:hypothetical protein
VIKTARPLFQLCAGDPQNDAVAGHVFDRRARAGSILAPPAGDRLDARDKLLQAGVVEEGGQFDARAVGPLRLHDRAESGRLLGRHVFRRRVGGGDEAPRHQRVDQDAENVARIVVFADEMEDGDQQEPDRFGEVERVEYLASLKDLAGLAQVGLEVGRPAAPVSRARAWTRTSGSLST